MSLMFLFKQEFWTQCRGMLPIPIPTIVLRMQEKPPDNPHMPYEPRGPRMPPTVPCNSGSAVITAGRIGDTTATWTAGQQHRIGACRCPIVLSFLASSTADAPSAGLGAASDAPFWPVER